MAANNPFYHKCFYLETEFHNLGISSYCKYICTRFNMILSTTTIKTMCCISNSPYQEKNCKYFKDKSGTEQTTLFGGN